MAPCLGSEQLLVSFCLMVKEVLEREGRGEDWGPAPPSLLRER